MTNTMIAALVIMCLAENEAGIGYGDVIACQTLLTMGYSWGYILG